MNFQDASNLRIPEGYVRTIHDKNNRLLWGSVGYNVSFDGDSYQQTYSGKNLFDGANPTNANFATTSLSNDIVTVSSTTAATVPHAKWVIEGLNQNDVIRYSAIIQDNNGKIILQYDNNGSWVAIVSSTEQYTDGTTPATYTWTNTANTTKVRFLLYANKTIPTGNSSSRYKNVILTVNNSDLSYEPFVGGIPAPNPSYPQPISVVTGENTVKIDGSGDTQEFPIDLGSIELAKIGTYQDRIYKENGKWWLHKEVGKAAIDTSAITQIGNYSNIEYATTAKPSDFAGYGNYQNIGVLCSHAAYQDGGDPAFWDQSSNAGHIYTRADNRVFWIGFAKGTGLNAMKTALANCIIYYPLATPTTTEITNQTLIDQLEAVYDWVRRHGYNAQVSGDLPIVINRTALPTV